MSETREIKVPSLGESVSEATIARWAKKVGEAVAEDEILVELETDKVTLEVTAPAAGVLQKVLFEKGAPVQVGNILGIVEIGKPSQQGEVLPAAVEKEKEAKSGTGSVRPAPSGAAINELLAPSVRRLVEEKGINPGAIQGTGKGNRLTKEDLMAHQTVSAPLSSSDNKPISHQAEERVRMTRLRQKIAERLKYAQNTAAILTTFNEVDMSAVNKLRSQYKEKFEKKYGIRIGFMSFFVKAAIQALKEIPAINAEIDGEDIIYKNYYDIGVAVSAPQGLVVPVVRDADQLSFAEIEAKISELGVKAKEGKLTMQDMSGGTFTVSNGGVFGSLMSTPILNPPQSGILGMHKVQERPVVVEGKIEIRPMMYIALSYDHRLIDGREAVTFLVRVKENIENPERLLLEI